jgi:predicted RNase H-related nuclease YkuK (DUF458 family)
MEITEDTLFRNLSQQNITFDMVADKIIDYIDKEPDKDYVLAIGTDSQTASETKVVLSITLHRLYNGGIFFLHTKYHQAYKRNQLHQKLYEETQASLDAAEILIEKLKDRGLDIQEETSHIHLSIHMDIGEHGPTSKYIQELEGWVRAVGYDYEIKPNSYAASTIADKYSK